MDKNHQNLNNNTLSNNNQINNQLPNQNINNSSEMNKPVPINNTNQRKDDQKETTTFTNKINKPSTALANANLSKKKSLKSLKSNRSNRPRPVVPTFAVNRLDMKKIKKKLLTEVENNKKLIFKDNKDGKEKETTNSQDNKTKNSKDKEVIDNFSQISEIKSEVKSEMRSKIGRVKEYSPNPFIRDTQYEELSMKYINENYSMRTLNIVSRIVQSSRISNQINCSFPLHSILLKLCRMLLLNDFELCVFFIYLERFGWQNDVLDINIYLYVIGILAKQQVSDKAEVIINAVYTEIPELESSYQQFLHRIQLDKYNILHVEINELNSKYLSLTTPYNPQCKENFLDYNFCVDQILTMSLPYSENKKNNNNVKSLMNTLSVPTFKVENSNYNSHSIVNSNKLAGNIAGNYQDNNSYLGASQVAYYPTSDSYSTNFNSSKPNGLSQVNTKQLNAMSKQQKLVNSQVPYNLQQSGHGHVVYRQLYSGPNSYQAYNINNLNNANSLSNGNQVNIQTLSNKTQNIANGYNNINPHDPNNTNQYQNAKIVDGLIKHNPFSIGTVAHTGNVIPSTEDIKENFSNNYQKQPLNIRELKDEEKKGVHRIHSFSRTNYNPQPNDPAYFGGNNMYVDNTVLQIGGEGNYDNLVLKNSFSNINAQFPQLQFGFSGYGHPYANSELFGYNAGFLGQGNMQNQNMSTVLGQKRGRPEEELLFKKTSSNSAFVQVNNTNNNKESFDYGNNNNGLYALTLNNNGTSAYLPGNLMNTESRMSIFNIQPSESILNRNDSYIHIAKGDEEFENPNSTKDKVSQTRNTTISSKARQPTSIQDNKIIFTSSFKSEQRNSKVKEEVGKSPDPEKSSYKSPEENESNNDVKLTSNLVIFNTDLLKKKE